MDDGRVIFGTDGYMRDDVSAVVHSEIENLLRWSPRERLNEDPYVDECEYNLNQTYRGLAVVISNQTFDHHSPREYAAKDIEMMSSVFKSMDLMVLKFKNLTAKQMFEVLTSVASLEDFHAKSAMFACAIGSHGEEILQKGKKEGGKRADHDHVIHGTDFPISTKLLVNTFSDMNCKTLKGKPRLFFIQACRSRYYQRDLNFDKGVTVNVETEVPNKPIVPEQDTKDVRNITCEGTGTEKGGDVLPNEISDDFVVEGWKFKHLLKLRKTKELRENTCVPCPNHFCIIHATAPGKYALGRKNQGGWMFMNVFKVLEEDFLLLQSHFVSEIDILQALTKSINEVALSMRATDPSQKDKTDEPSYIYTAPCVEHRLTKNIVFRKQ